ncbi:RNA polymerase I-specific transcription initiation factor RRN3 [Brachionus plicatilis]|uniref:RNA polymerase I-specific transcription initiation factor RRN3 n=1 Tax=Brachionus plicatilis TaxID=10195 RepID=A0A3M7P8W6_BRAPC|nr:RNA polymerase I-specific transcription initiation factor RRN3 [Brachionus plicatilis]
MQSSTQISKLDPSPAAKTAKDSQFNLKKLIENYINDVNKHEFEFFVSSVKQKQSSADFLTKLLKELRHLVDRLDPNKFDNSFINVLFYEIKWTEHSTNKAILDALCEFLIDLNSAYTSYVHKCLGMMIKMFTLTKDNNVDCENMFSLAHKMIQNLVKIAPTSKSHIIKLCESIYPYMIKDTAVQEAFIKNLLKLADQFKDLRLTILEICVQKLLKIDVNSTREQIAETEIPNDDQLLQESVPEENAPKAMKHPLADRLDVKMSCLFEYIRQKCLDPETKELSWESCKSIYKDLLFTFDKYILFTYGSSHVQFVMFYICSFRTLLSEGFLDYLWKKFNATSSCAITKQICSYYIGSYLARAKYIPITTCVATLQLMVTWIHNYIEKNANTSNASNFDLHRTFYALCQTVFYVVIFRNRQLFNTGNGSENSKMTELVKSWKLNEIISSKLNPLKYCLPTVRKKFARITYVNQIAYCYTIIDTNSRTSLPISGQSSLNLQMFFSNQSDSFGSKNENSKNVSFLDNPLDSFFPFDPYLLIRSKNYIEKVYVEFKDIFSEYMDESSEEDDEEEEDEVSENDYDSDDDNDSSVETDMDTEESDDFKTFRMKIKKNTKLNSNFFDSDLEDSMDK